MRLKKAICVNFKKTLRMRIFCFLFLLLLAHTAWSQQEVEGMVRAEKSFAADALALGTTKAFLKYADSNAIMFHKGKAVNALALWQQREPPTGVLAWWPVWSEVSAGGDFGFSAGPWTFQPRTVNDPIIGRGYFATVWQRRADGEWKFLMDFGVEGAPAADTCTLKLIQNTESIRHHQTVVDLKRAEEDFLKLWLKSPAAAYSRYLSMHTVLLRNEAMAATTVEQIQEAINNLPENLLLHSLGAFTAPSGDLGYSFGSVTYAGRTDNYVHLWRREKKGWKIAVEMMSY
jgi:ketosteroid isomerase-like protein